MNAALVGVQKIAAVREKSATFKIHGAFRPPCGTQAAREFWRLFSYRESVAYLVGNAGGSGGNETATADYFFPLHTSG